MKTFISRDTLLQRLERDPRPILVEALPEKYYRRWHLPHAININHDEIEQKAPKLLPDKQREIIVYCASPTCRNSDIAADQLVALGYASIGVYKGGKEDWEAAGLSPEEA